MTTTTRAQPHSCRRDGEHDHDHAAEHEHGHDLAGEHGAGIARWLPSGQRRELLLLGVSGVCLGVGLAAELLGWPETLRIGLFLVAILAGAVEIVPRGLRGVWLERSLDINFLVTVAVAGAIGAGAVGRRGDGSLSVQFGRSARELDTRTHPALDPGAHGDGAGYRPGENAPTGARQRSRSSRWWLVPSSSCAPGTAFRATG